MERHDVKMGFILLILIFACIIIFTQLECLHCKCNCRRKNRNVQQIIVQAAPLETVVIGEPVIDRGNDTVIQAIVINMIE